MTQVEVECVALYDERKWVIIGKEKDGMKPQDVQYAQALKPSYHLASFSKMAGNSTKGKVPLTKAPWLGWPRISKISS